MRIFEEQLIGATGSILSRSMLLHDFAKKNLLILPRMSRHGYHFYHQVTRTRAARVPGGDPFHHRGDPGQLVEFAKAAFGAEELREQRGTTDDGKTMHAAFRIEGCIIEAGRASDQWKAMPTALHLYVRDAESAYARALKAGGVSLHEVREMDYGERAAAVRDPFGNHWYIATYTGGRGQKS